MHINTTYSHSTFSYSIMYKQNCIHELYTQHTKPSSHTSHKIHAGYYHIDIIATTTNVIAHNSRTRLTHATYARDSHATHATHAHDSRTRVTRTNHAHYSRTRITHSRTDAHTRSDANLAHGAHISIDLMR